MIGKNVKSHVLLHVRSTISTECIPFGKTAGYTNMYTNVHKCTHAALAETENDATIANPTPNAVNKLQLIFRNISNSKVK